MRSYLVMLNRSRSKAAIWQLPGDYASVDRDDRLEQLYIPLETRGERAVAVADVLSSLS